MPMQMTNSHVAKPTFTETFKLKFKTNVFGQWQTSSGSCSCGISFCAIGAVHRCLAYLLTMWLYANVKWQRPAERSTMLLN